VFDRLARQDLEVAGKRLGLAPAVGFDDANDHVHAFSLPAGGLGKHLVGLADPRGHAQEDLEPAAPRLGRFGEKRVRVGAAGLGRIHEGLG